MNQNDYEVSRFFNTDDDHSNHLLYPIKDEWWSRSYEYIWASKFTNENDIVLDAACGVEHNFKYNLVSLVKKVFCCDMDSRLSNKNLMLDIINQEYGGEVKTNVEKIYDKIDFNVCNLTSLPYESKKFDKIFCISVLEHLSNEDMTNTLKEFRRILKDDGFIILTFDYPSIDFDLFNNALKSSFLIYAKDVNYTMEENILESSLYPGLKCFRALLRKSSH